MAGALTISIPVQMNGAHTLDDFILAPGGAITTTSGLSLTIRDDVYLLGSIVAQNGASIEITCANGSIFVFGTVLGSDGAQGTVPGENGKNGGVVSLRAPEDLVQVTGLIATGRGGDGSASLNFPSPVDCFAASGGNGGDLHIEAQRIALFGATLQSGPGGNGGDAKADGWDIEEWIAWQLRSGWTGGDLMTHIEPVAPPNIVPKAEGADDYIQARSGSGGPGGFITLTLNASGSFGFSDKRSKVISGRGGNSGRAEAVRGIKSIALTGTPGAGGDVHYVSVGAGVWTIEGQTQLGDGGSAHLAAAWALESASASNTAGAAGGKLVAFSAKPVAIGHGGGVDKAEAHTPNCDRSDGPHEGQGSQPGNPAASQCP